ncbi:MAG TPA: PCMD domain-containing protein [Candidatus Coprenecus pullistercoris]|nr:PCMD domain-containing protein [Candidatus Coprenecus pullistercoris]
MLRHKITISIVAAVLLFAAAGCIKNDIPYPKKLGAITAFEVQGQLSPAVIDSTALTVTVDVADTVDLNRVRLLRFETTSNTTVTPAPDTAVIDLSAPAVYVLDTWPGQSYRWTVSATQTIDRYIRVHNQIGEASINAGECEAVVYVTLDTPLDSIEITDMKLGPSGSEIYPDPASVHDFTVPRTFSVSFRDEVEEWTVAVVPREVTLTTGEADAWACSAYLSGMVPEGSESPGFMYRRSQDTEWLPVTGVEVSGTGVTALLSGLEPAADYVYKIYSGDMEGNEVSFTTEAALQMPNMGFDEWTSVDECWYPNPDMESGYWWDSGNPGANVVAALLGSVNPTSPEESFVAVSGEGKKAAMMETVMVFGIKMAGGNVFSGQFLDVTGMNARVQFGRPFTTRPLTLNGYYSYAPVAIDRTDAAHGHMRGRIDRCHIFVYVTDWEAPYVVDTGAGIYLDVDDPHVIGYGELIDSTGTDGEYREFSIDIKYRSHRKPTYCAVVAVASQYADYFTGGVGSRMYVDEFSFGYTGDIIWEEER